MLRIILMSLLLSAFVRAENPQLIQASPPITLQNGFIGIPQANGSTNGFISAADWTSFNAKASSGSPVFSGSVTAQNLKITSATPNTFAGFDASGFLISFPNPTPIWGTITGTLANQTDLQSALNAKANLSGATFTGAVSATNLTGSNNGDVTLGTANGLSLSGQSLSLQLSSTSQTGSLNSTDWNTFNSKQAAGSYLTALTGDITASGPGSSAATLATVNGNVGSFTNASLTVNAKGLITAASSGAAAVSSVTASSPLASSGGTTPNLTITGSSLTEATSSVLVITGGTASQLDATTVQVKQSSTSQSGYLSSTDWNTFNSKQPAGAYANGALSNLTNPTAINQSLLFGTDAVNTIGASGASRPLDIFAERQVIVGNSSGQPTLITLDPLNNVGATIFLGGPGFPVIQASGAHLTLTGQGGEIDINGQGAGTINAGVYNATAEVHYINIGATVDGSGSPSTRVGQRFFGGYFSNVIRVGESNQIGQIILNKDLEGGSTLNVQGRIPLQWLDGRNGANVTTTANATTTINAVTTGTGPFTSASLSPGDIVQLVGTTTSAPVTVTAINSETQFTVNSPTGDGSTQIIEIFSSIARLTDHLNNLAFQIDANGAFTIGISGTSQQNTLNTLTAAPASGIGTLTNLPIGVSGNPAGYIQMTINGATHYIPYF